MKVVEEDRCRGKTRLRDESTKLTTSESGQNSLLESSRRVMRHRTLHGLDELKSV